MSTFILSLLLVIQKQLKTDELKSISILVFPSEKLNIIKTDPADNIILECTKEFKADFIISGDNHLIELGIFESIKIVTPNTFLTQLDK